MSDDKLTYCLGYTHTKCDNCQHEKNWKDLNQLPCELRLSIQKNSIYINSDVCRLRNMGAYQPIKEPSC